VNDEEQFKGTDIVWPFVIVSGTHCHKK